MIKSTWRGLRREDLMPGEFYELELDDRILYGVYYKYGVFKTKDGYIRDNKCIDIKLIEEA